MTAMRRLKADTPIPVMPYLVKILYCVRIDITLLTSTITLILSQDICPENELPRSE